MYVFIFHKHKNLDHQPSDQNPSFKVFIFIFFILLASLNDLLNLSDPKLAARCSLSLIRSPYVSHGLLLFSSHQHENRSDLGYYQQSGYTGQSLAPWRLPASFCRLMGKQNEGQGMTGIQALLMPSAGQKDNFIWPFDVYRTAKVIVGSVACSLLWLLSPWTLAWWGTPRGASNTNGDSKWQFLLVVHVLERVSYDELK